MKDKRYIVIVVVNYGEDPSQPWQFAPDNTRTYPTPYAALAHIDEIIRQGYVVAELADDAPANAPKLIAHPLSCVVQWHITEVLE